MTLAKHANARSNCNTRVESLYTQGITVRPVLVRVLNDYILNQCIVYSPESAQGITVRPVQVLFTHKICDQMTLRRVQGPGIKTCLYAPIRSKVFCECIGMCRLCDSQPTHTEWVY